MDENDRRSTQDAVSRRRKSRMVVRLRCRRVQSGAAAQADRGEAGMSEMTPALSARTERRAIVSPAAHENPIADVASCRRRVVFQQPAKSDRSGAARRKRDGEPLSAPLQTNGEMRETTRSSRRIAEFLLWPPRSIPSLASTISPDPSGPCPKSDRRSSPRPPDVSASFAGSTASFWLLHPDRIAQMAKAREPRFRRAY